jgi:hypothetical protein
MTHEQVEKLKAVREKIRAEDARHTKAKNQLINKWADLMVDCDHVKPDGVEATERGFADQKYCIYCGCTLGEYAVKGAK